MEKLLNDCEDRVLSDAVAAETELRECMPAGMELYLTGSVYIVGHGKDIDYLTYASPDDVGNLLLYMARRGYAQCSDGSYESSFYSLRKGSTNLIIVTERGVLERWLAAAEICRVIKATDKQTRAIIHECVKFQYTADVIKELYATT